MKVASQLNVMPPFYKGLSQGEMGLLALIGMTVLGLAGLMVSVMTGYPIIFVSGLLMGVMSVFALPNAWMRALGRLKTHHCQHYLAKQAHRRFHASDYLTQSRRFASKRSEES
jgi:conjugative transfer region protein (TIGR03750 family)